MATEGQFPKIDGDILYASEANRFASAGRFLAIGSTPILTSGTAAGSVIGSIFVAAASLSNPAYLDFYGFLSNANQRNSVRFMFSGTTAGNVLSTTTGSNNGTNIHVLGRFVLGNTIGTSIVESFTNAISDTGVLVGNHHFGTVALGNFNPGSAFSVIFLADSPAQSDLQYTGFSLQSFRGIA